MLVELVLALLVLLFVPKAILHCFECFRQWCCDPASTACGPCRGRGVLDQDIHEYYYQEFIGDHRPPQLPWGASECLPEYAFDATAASLRADEDYGLMLKQVASKVVPTLWKTLTVEATIYFVVTMVTYAVARCSGLVALASVPTWLQAAPPICAIYLLSLEHQVRRPVIVPVARRMCSEIAPDVIVFAASFWKWFAFNNAVSGSGYMSLALNGIFMGRVLAMCEFEKVWRLQLEHSASSLATVPFWVMALAIWLITPLDMLYAVLLVKPLTGKDDEGRELQYDFVSLDIAEGPASPFDLKLPQSYRPYASKFLECLKLKDDSRITPTDALVFLLSTTRMATISDLVQKTLMKECEIDAFENPHFCGKRFVQNLGHFVLFNVLEGAGRLILQSASLGITRAVSLHHQADWLTAGTLAIGMALALYNLYKMIQWMQLLRNAVNDCDLLQETQQVIEMGITKFAKANPGFAAMAPMLKAFARPFAEALAMGWWKDEAVWTQVKAKQEIAGALQILQMFQYSEDFIRGWGNRGSLEIVEGRKYQRMMKFLWPAFLLVVFLYLILIAFAAAHVVTSIWSCDTGLHGFWTFECLDF